MPESVTPQELWRAIDAGRPPAILDVRYPSEFAEGRVPGAVNVPYWHVLAPASKLPASVDEPLVIYCGHGPRAGIFRAVLRLRGYRRVVVLAGHWAAWRQARLPQEPHG